MLSTAGCVENNFCTLYLKTLKMKISQFSAYLCKVSSYISSAVKKIGQLVCQLICTSCGEVDTSVFSMKGLLLAMLQVKHLLSFVNIEN